MTSPRLHIVDGSSEPAFGTKESFVISTVPAFPSEGFPARESHRIAFIVASFCATTHRCNRMPDFEEPDRTEEFPPAPPGYAFVGDPAAWDHLVRTYGPMVWNLVRKRSNKRRVDPEDLWQEVWKALFRAFRSLQRTSVRGTFRGWVFTVARRAAREATGRMANHPTEELTDELADALLDCGPDPAAVLRQGLDRAEVQAALVELRSRVPEDSYRIVVMHDMDGRSAPQIAAELSISEDSVKGRPKRARKKLAALLRMHGFGPP
jgi:RNA polymerase sigma-70 factor (ECF subfamily)